jgi:hypothetical protein
VKRGRLDWFVGREREELPMRIEMQKVLLPESTLAQAKPLVGFDKKA